MKWNFVIVATLVVFSATAHAFEIKNGKLLSHKEWVTKSDTQGIFKSIKSAAFSQISQKFALSTIAENSDNIFVKDTVDELPYYHDNKTDFSGYVSSRFKNVDMTTHTYTISNSVCADYIFNTTDDNSKQCYDTVDVIQLAPGGSSYYYGKPTLTMNGDIIDLTVVTLNTEIKRDNLPITVATYDQSVLNKGVNQ